MSEELIEVVDQNGKPTDQIATKKKIHSQGLWHRTAHVWIVNSRGELLLQRRGPQMETSPNCWDISSAGHISAGENTFQGACREISEELGLHVDAQDLELLGTVHTESFHHDGSYINREHQDVFLIMQNVDPRKLTPQASEVSEFMVMSWTELKKKVEAHDKEFVSHDDEYQLLFRIMSERYPNANPR